MRTIIPKIRFVSAILISGVLFLLPACQKGISADYSRTTAGMPSSIVYTDVNPDSSIKCFEFNGTCSHFYDIDLNKDGVNDFTFFIHSGSSARVCGAECTGNSNYVRVSPASGSVNEIETDGDFPEYPIALDSLTSIDVSQENWSSFSNRTLTRYDFCPCGGGSSMGNWINEATKYLGVKLIKGTDTYYGWVKLSVVVSGVSSMLTIKEYAYNSISKKVILAGQIK